MGRRQDEIHGRLNMVNKNAFERSESAKDESAIGLSRREALGVLGGGAIACAVGASANEVPEPETKKRRQRSRDWRASAGVTFKCRKQSAVASRGMVVTNHPLASIAGAQMLAEGGNAVDAAICAFFALTIVEPMMVGVLGGGVFHLRTPDGKHRTFDGYSVAPLASRPDMYRPLNVEPFYDFTAVEGRENSIGAKAIGVPGNLAVWCHVAEKFGRFPLETLIEPALRYARRGFSVTPYLAASIERNQANIALDPNLAELVLPNGKPLVAGDRLVQAEAAESLQTIAREGPRALYGGEIGRQFVDYVSSKGGYLSMEDLRRYRMVERDPVRGNYRGYEIVGPAPPAAGGVHIVQMLNVLEGFDPKSIGFGTPNGVHLIAEVMKLAFADRAMALADPAFIKAPIETLTSKEYAARRRREVDLQRARAWGPGIGTSESSNTTHVTVADADGHVVSATHTINGQFGSCMLVPGVGFIPDNYMFAFDPRPGRALSVAPGKRVTSSMSPMIVLENGQPRYALGLPGGLTIFGNAMQAIVNLIDHGMSLQEAVEAPRIWTQGGALEVEDVIPEGVRAVLRSRGHEVVEKPNVGGGMSGIAIRSDGSIEGAACWRADGTPVGVAGGWAQLEPR
jgi:gamma-glutamyltranspeptidase/glutathione hydrolase